MDSINFVFFQLLLIGAVIISGWLFAYLLNRKKSWQEMIALFCLSAVIYFQSGRWAVGIVPTVLVAALLLKSAKLMHAHFPNAH